MSTALIRTAGICFGLLLASACSKAPETAEHTVDYYRQHADVRAAKVRECTNNPGELRDKPDCINAIQAEKLAGIGSLRDLPAMGLTAPPLKAEKAPGQ